jgi:hypothetical protein
LEKIIEILNMEVNNHIEYEKADSVSPQKRHQFLALSMICPYILFLTSKIFGFRKYGSGSIEDDL